MMKITILHDVQAAPDHNHTRLYQVGEDYEIDAVNEACEVLMPQWLADALTSGGYMQRAKGFRAPKNEGITHVPTEEVPAAKIT